MKKIIILIVTLSLLPACIIHAQTVKSAFLFNPRSMGMGGVGVAAAKGSYSYLYNPALLTKEKFSLDIPGVQLELRKQFFDILDYVVQHREDFSKLNKNTMTVSHEEKATIIQELRSDAAEFDNVWYRAVATPSLGVVVNNYAFSIYNIAQFASKIDVGIIVPKVNIYALNDLVFSFGYGRQVNENLSLGIGAKIIKRYESPIIEIRIEEMSSMNDIIDEGLNEMKHEKRGYGLDLGALYRINDKLELGAVAQDILGDIEGVDTPFYFNLGMAYQYDERLVLAADLNDFFNRDGDKFTNKIFLGAEYSLPIIHFRLGFGQGYPAAGIGIDLKVFKFSYTFYTKEITDSPGEKGESYHFLGLNLGWQ